MLDREEYCVVRDCNNAADEAHIRTRAVLSKTQWKAPAMIFYLCRRHHTEQHTIGIESFCKKYDLMHYLDNARDIQL